MKVLLSIAILAFIITFILYMLLKRDIIRMTNDIKEYKNVNSKVSIKTNSVDKNIGELTTEINSLIDIKQNAVNDYRKIDKKLKETVANISHDIRTPLTSLMGYIDLLSSAEDDGNRERYLEILKDRSESMELLLEDFYDIARIDSGDYPLELSKINLSSILEDKMLSYYTELSLRNINPILEIEENVEIISDINAINRIVSNMIQNTIRYAQKEIKVVLLSEDGKAKLFFINDIGDNLEDVDVERIFDRSYIGNKSRTSGGTGLGLAINKELSNALGHEIFARKSERKFVIGMEFNLI